VFLAYARCVLVENVVTAHASARPCPAVAESSVMACILITVELREREKECKHLLGMETSIVQDSFHT